MIRNSIKSLRFLSILIASVFLLLEGGCGGTSGSSSSGAGKGDGGGSSGSGVSLSGSVEAPRTTTTSISVGSSASKSVGKGVGSEDSGETIIVSKATTELPVSGGECICKKLDGTKLDEFEINSAGQFSGANINPALLDSSKQVLIDCKTGGGGRFSTLCDLTSASAGTTINCGKTNTDTTLSVSQTISLTLAGEQKLEELLRRSLHAEVEGASNNFGVRIGDKSRQPFCLRLSQWIQTVSPFSNV